MAGSTLVFHIGNVAPARAAESLWREAWRRFRRHRLAMVGAAVLLTMVGAVIAGPFVYKVPIDEIDFRAKLKTPSWTHPFGTDDLGQDLLARMLYGGRISIAVGIVAMLIAISAGPTQRRDMPEIAPIVVPTTIATIMAERPTASEMRPP